MAERLSQLTAALIQSLFRSTEREDSKAMYHKVFMSHSHADNVQCDAYAAALRELKIDVWYDRTNLEGGQLLSSTIQRELEVRTAFMVMLSPNSLKSYWVGLETDGYRDLVSRDPGRLILPIRIANCEIPILLRGVKCIDAYEIGFRATINSCEQTLRLADPVLSSVDSVEGKRVAPLSDILTQSDAQILLSSYPDSNRLLDELAVATKQTMAALLCGSDRDAPLTTGIVHAKRSSCTVRHHTYSGVYERVVLAILLAFAQSRSHIEFISEQPLGISVRAGLRQNWVGLSRDVSCQLTRIDDSNVAATWCLEGGGNWSGTGVDASSLDYLIEQSERILAGP